VRIGGRDHDERCILRAEVQLPEVVRSEVQLRNEVNSAAGGGFLPLAVKSGGGGSMFSPASILAQAILNFLRKIAPSEEMKPRCPMIPRQAPGRLLTIPGMAARAPCKSSTAATAGE